MTQEMSLDRMRELAAGVQPEAPQEAPQETPEDAPQEAPEGELEGQDLDVGQAEEQPQEAPKDKKKHFIPKERLDEVNAKAREHEQRAVALEQKYNELMQFVEQKLSGEEKGKQTEDEDIDLDALLEDAVDSDAIKAVVKKTKALESQLDKYKQGATQTAFSGALDKADQVGNTNFPDYNNALNHLINMRTQQAFMAAKSVGYDFTPEQARQAAIENFTNELQSVYQGNPNAATLAQYAYYQAAASGFQPTKQTKKGVDMAAVENLRNTAGAPSYDKAESPAKPMKTMKQTIAEEYKKRNPDADMSYLKKLGIM